MAPRTIYANLADGLQPFSLWDQSFADMANLGIIPCTAVGANAITLTPLASAFAPNVTTPNQLQEFVFAAAGNSTGPVTIQIGTLAAKNLYLADGVTQASNGHLKSGAVYNVCFNSALNSSAGGFQVSANGGSIGGLNTQVLYNNGGAFGGITNVTTDGTNITLGTPISGTLTNCTGLPVTGVTGLAAGVATFLATPTSANLATALTDETGTGAAVFANTPTLTTPEVTDKIFVGGVNVDVSGNSLLIANASRSLSGNGHEFAANSTITNQSVGAAGHNSFDDEVTFTGTFSQNHHAAFQSLFNYNSSGTLAAFYGMNLSPTFNNGATTTVTGFNFNKPTIGASATINTIVGFFVDNIASLIGAGGGHASDAIAWQSNGLARSVFGGQIISVGQGNIGQWWINGPPTVDGNAAGHTWTVAQFLTGYILRSGVAAPFSDTTPTAAQIIDAAGYGPARTGSAVTAFLPIRIWNETASVQTIVGGTGVTVSGTATIAAGAVGTFILEITNNGTGTESALLIRFGP
jgi:hypothetical protein